MPALGAMRAIQFRYGLVASVVGVQQEFLLRLSDALIAWFNRAIVWRVATLSVVSVVSGSRTHE